MTDLLEDRIISEEYKLWKKNTPFLYDHMWTRSLEWPSPTVQWYPEVDTVLDEVHNCDATIQRLLLGTHTGLVGVTETGEPAENYIVVAPVYLPGYPERKQQDIYHMREDEWGQISNFFDKWLVEFKVPHDGVVHCARLMPKNSNIVATRNESDLFVYDLTSCNEPLILPSTPSDEEETEDEKDETLPKPVLDDDVRPIEPLFQCLNAGVSTDLEWNCQLSTLLTGYQKEKIAIWDLYSLSTQNSTPKVLDTDSMPKQNGRKKKNSKNKIKHSKGLKTSSPPVVVESRKSLEPSVTYTGHQGVVTNVAWHKLFATIFSSVSSTGQLALWDTRSVETTRPSHMVDAHKFDITDVQFSPFSEYVLATTSLDRSIALWDLRNLRLKLHSIQVREENFTRLRWSPHYSQLLGAINADRKVFLFDLDKIFEEQTPDDADDGPATLMFSHNGHTSKIWDFAFNPADELTLASVSDDNIVQIWQPIAKFLHSR